MTDKPKSGETHDEDEDLERRAEEEEEGADDEELDEEGDDEEEEEDEEEAAQAKEPAPIRGAPPPPPPPPSPDQDPTWWLPHAVLGALVVIGVLGFFGAFNSSLGKFFKRSDAGAAPVAAETAKPAAAEAPKPTASAGRQPPPQRQPPPAAGPVYGAKHLVVQWKGATRSRQERSKDEAKKRTEEALAKLKGGAKFEDVAKEYSDEPGVANTGGNLGRFSRAGFDPQFVDAVEKLKVGEQSGLVESAFGYHIIVRTE
jgi:parvulin-like peptidyl-prolyl isomerase